ncbi:hypothetical protein [Paraburkholderia ultramafica]|nr:hypothetical protein [Paraburkholderia ultramafica]
MPPMIAKARERSITWQVMEYPADAYEYLEDPGRRSKSSVPD